jgi:hypothetical protein
VTTLLEVSTALDAALTIPNLAHFPGGPPDDAAMPRDDAGRAKPYVASYLGAGQATSSRHGGLRRSIDVPLDLAVPFQVTAAAGTYEGALWAAGKVRAALTGLLLIANAQTTRLRETTDPGPFRRDEDVPDDVRWYLPMQYRFTTTT